jgi:hypothetical protein
MENTWLNDERFLEGLKRKLNADMLSAAEPVLQKALVDAEKKMRESLASNVVAFLDHSFSVERYGSDLRILVKHEREIN